MALQTQLWCIDVDVKPWCCVVVKKLSNTGERERVPLQDCVFVALRKNLKGVIPKEGGLQEAQGKTPVFGLMTGKEYIPICWLCGAGECSMISTNCPALLASSVLLFRPARMRVALSATAGILS